MENKEILEQLQKTWYEFKSVLEEQDKEIKKFNTALPETIEKVERLNARMDELETKLNRPPIYKDSEPSSSKELEIFYKWLRKGEVGPEEIKALIVSDDTSGGYLAPKEYVAEIIKGIVEFSPIRSIATVRTTSQRSIMIPKRTSALSAYWTSELGTSTPSQPAFGLMEVPVHEMTAEVRISVQDLEDSAFNLEAEIQQECAEQFGVLEGASFINGNGVGKPLGLLQDNSVQFTVSGNGSAITADGLISLFYDVKDTYARNGVWVLNRKTLKAIRQLKDTVGNYLWSPGIAGAEPPNILGRPYVDAPDMPDISGNAFPVIFGDFKRGYLIVDRTQISILRDPYSLSSSRQIKFVASKRVGGQVVLAEAIRKLKIAAS